MISVPVPLMVAPVIESPALFLSPARGSPEIIDSSTRQVAVSTTPSTGTLSPWTYAQAVANRATQRVGHPLRDHRRE